MLILPLLLALLSLLLTTSFLLRRIAGPENLLIYPLSFALTISLTGYLYYLCLLFHFDYRLLLGGIILSGVLSSWAHYADKRKQFLPAFPSVSKLKMLLMAIAALALTVGFNDYVYRWGDWDAWAIWNLHAKFLFYPHSWTNMFLFADKMSVTHPDYPLMLPSVIAFIWRGVDSISPFAPIAIAHLILLAIPLTVFLALNRFGHVFAAASALAIFALDTKFINLAASQYADTLLALFILIAFVLYKETAAGGNMKMLVLLGFFAGSATWVKNEGQLFFAVFSVVFLCQNLRKPTRVLWYCAGALIPVLILLHFKLVLAPANDLVHANRGAELLILITSPGRYWLIIKHLVLTAIQYYWVVMLLLIIVLINKAAFVKSTPFAVISLVLAGYFVVYLTTPHDLSWHLGASADRLLHHLYPACIYLILLKLSSTGEVNFWTKFKF
ncbi:hypothetical protein [Dyadobacter aurulentus]|uniref:hypothetical protein n=1 Tax=Dyadobacter sp. UC 10 TaxID=2605428 RepID=UPI0011F2F9D7|nr:hypothetical protein [Dyadobacter sp. UC 10]KAA0988839.1 hypothetical protein FXO21_01005 [Dyadobacter sp. UC 10]